MARSTAWNSARVAREQARAAKTPKVREPARVPEATAAHGMATADRREATTLTTTARAAARAEETDVRHDLLLTRRNSPT